MHHRTSHTTLFADDTNILVSSIGLNELNSILCSFSEWFQNNQLVLNLNKMHIVKFASSKLLRHVSGLQSNLEITYR